MKVRLTKHTIDQATYQGSGSWYLWDTEIAGFALRIYPSGRRSFLVAYRVAGRQRFFIFGRYGEMTVQQARTQAHELLARIRKGEDPGHCADQHSPTVADLADRHIQEHARIKNKARSAKRARQLWDRCVLPKIGKRKVADVQRADVARLITDMAETQAMANKVISLLSMAFNLCEIWGWRPEGSNPCRHIQRFKEEGRERYLSESELRRLGEVLAKIEDEQTTLPQAVAAIRLLILTGCRSAEILGLRWQDVDFERRCLHLPDSKTGKRIVVLNTAAMQILADMERVDGNPYVIPGARPGNRLSSLQRLWDRIRVEADIKDVRCHDLRHTYASYGVNGGQNLAVVGKPLGHTKITTTQRYAHLADDPIRHASEQIGATLAANLKGQPKAEIREIRPAF